MSKLLTVTGLDVSTKTGCVTLREQFGVPEVVREATLTSKRVGIQRVDDIASQVVEVVKTDRPGLVVFEGYGFANAHSLATLVEIGTACRFCVYHLGVPFLVVPPSTMKMFVTGKGNAKKDQIALHLYKTYGYEAPNDDVADAYALAAVGLASKHKLHMSLPKTHTRALDKLPKE